MVDVYVRHKHSFIQKLDVYSSSIERSLALAIWDFDEMRLESISDGVLKIPLVTGVSVRELMLGQAIVQKGQVPGKLGEAGSQNSGSLEVTFSFLEEDIIERPLTIYREGNDKPIAVLTLYSNQAMMIEGVKYSLLIILCSAVLKTLSLWFLFTLVLRRHLVKPLKELTDIVQGVNFGSISSSIIEKHKGEDELTRLSVVFNQMLLRLQEAGDELEDSNSKLNTEIRQKHAVLHEVQDLNDKLEHRVEMRTEELASAHDFMSQLIESIPNPVFYKHSDGDYRVVNEAFKSEFRIDDYNDNDCDKLTDGDFLDESGAAQEDKADAGIMSTREALTYESSLVDSRGNVHELLISKAPLKATSSQYQGVVGMMVNIENRKVLERELRTFATIDGLTGCYNRRYFMEQAQKEVSRGNRHHYLMALLYLDIDLFKHINDENGHHVGDRVLKQFASVCKGVCRDGDIVGRIGGEEFAIMLTHTTFDSAYEVANRLRTIIEGTEMNTRESIKITTSIGVSMVGHGIDLESSIQRADAALYQAKKMGRNRVECYQHIEQKGA